MLDLLIPRRCALCRRRAAGLCADCASALVPAPDVVAPPGLDDCRALLAYEGDAARLVAELKFRNHRDALDSVGRALAVLIHDLAATVDLITWAPTGAARRRARGYDQAELLARATARHIDTPAAATLRRRPGPPQTGAGRLDRLLGPSFEPIRPLQGRVVVVDDVWTTGATLAAAARSLRDAGASRVNGLTLAVRP